MVDFESTKNKQKYWPVKRRFHLHRLDKLFEAFVTSTVMSHGSRKVIKSLDISLGQATAIVERE